MDETLPDEVIGDAGRLRQVLLNLIGNGLKFTDRGGVSVIAEPGGDADEIRFSVRDTGIGIPQEEQERIFLDFEQGERRLTQQYAGTGLGLAISRQIVERMGGRLSLESAVGSGCTFQFTAVLPAQAENKHSLPDLIGMRVLILAPSEIQSSLIARRLRRWGAQVEIVSAAAEAETFLKQTPCNAVFIDHAIGTAEAGRLAGAAAQSERRLVMIAPADRPHLPALREAGFTGYLVKPVRVASLGTILTQRETAFEMPPPSATPYSGGSDTAAAGLSILVAEDNEINALLTRVLLQKLGHRPTMANDGAAAFAAWGEASDAGVPFDLILMDVHMPDVDGVDATLRIRAAEAADNKGRTPILALTANALAEERDLCLAAGMDDFLVKPLDRERLAAALELLAGRRSLAA